jgi:hypothetical protein
MPGTAGLKTERVSPTLSSRNSHYPVYLSAVVGGAAGIDAARWGLTTDR